MQLGIFDNSGLCTLEQHVLHTYDSKPCSNTASEGSMVRSNAADICRFVVKHSLLLRIKMLQAVCVKHLQLALVCWDPRAVKLCLYYGHVKIVHVRPTEPPRRQGTPHTNTRLHLGVTIPSVLFHDWLCDEARGST